METSKTINSELLVRFFSGDCTSEEAQRIEAWRKRKEENDQIFEDFKKVWKSDYQTLLSSEMLEGDWARIRARLHMPHRRRSIGFLGAFSRIAAVILVMLAVSSGLYVYWNVPGFGRWSAFQTGESVDSLRLPDNSIVYLNNHSSLKYLRNFEDGKRTVSLDGEGFFEVEHDAGNPFLVKTPDGLDVTVLGTAFHLQAGAGIENVELNVTEGTVGIKYRRFDEKVNAGQSIVVKNSKLEVHPTSDVNFLFWKTGELAFSQCSLEVIANTLQKHFKEIKEVDIDASSDVLVTTSFHNQSVSEVLEELELHFDKKFTLNKGVLIISE